MARNASPRDTLGLTHAGKRVDDSSTAQDKHRCHDDVGENAEDKEHDVRGRAPPRLDDLQDGVSGGSLQLHLHSQNAEQDNLRK